MKDQIILRVMTKIMIPFIMIFGFYVVTHGELGPGGGFQGGVIIASAFILYGLVYGAAAMRVIVPRNVTDALAAGGVLFYIGVGIFCMLRGDQFLDYSHLVSGKSASGESWGMTLVEYGVGMTVTCAMITIFNEITEGTVPPEAEADGAEE